MSDGDAAVGDVLQDESFDFGKVGDAVVDEAYKLLTYKLPIVHPLAVAASATV